MKQAAVEPSADAGARLLAQAIVVLAFAAAAVGFGWLIVSTDEWYVPALTLIVAARFAYDHFFA
jgi:uncharacterized RDD family membrane protein YckC